MPALRAKIAFVLLSILSTGVALGDDAPSPRLLTPWGEKLDKSSVLPEYPRPQMTREQWVNLNGEWDFALTPIDAEQPQEFGERILVPFPVESALSGVTRTVTPEDAVWYRRTFDPVERDGQRILMHFGAVDWETKVWVNGVEVGEHRGGFDAFSFDITDALSAEGPQTVVVRVTDPTNRGTQPHGKQSLEPGGIVYTAVTGIWQTVWLEPVPETRVGSLKMTPNLETEELEITVNVDGPAAGNAIVRIAAESEGGAPLRVTGKPGETLRLSVPQAHRWSPEDPYLYDLVVDVAVGPAGSREVVDSVKSYFGMRSVEVRPDEKGHQRIYLNGEETFSFGPLDQGWWPDGLYTAPTDEALKWDIELTKRYGFNTCRKHVKVEPARWYYWCDKLGLLVWQDMPNGDRGIGPNEEDLVRSESSEAIFRAELKAMMDGLANYPSIVIWVPFNEGWGQFKTAEILEWTKEYDPSRIVDGASGWTDRGVGDMIDMHSYPGPSMFDPPEHRASVLGEFGGLGLVVPGHTWLDSGSWGYQSYDSTEALTDEYRKLIDNLWIIKRDGLAAAIYTQTTDVEVEVNGLVTYDRKVLKIDPEKAAEWNKRLYGPAPELTTVLPTSQNPSSMGELWKYTTTAPAGDDWADADFDDSGWDTGRAGFGSPNTPGATVRTEWDTADIWLRRKVSLDDPAQLGDLFLRIHHDEDAEIYLDGQLLTNLSGYTVDYSLVSLPPETKKLLRSGDHVLAVHCHQVRGGQYVDVGFVAVRPGSPEEDSPSISSADVDHVRAR